MSAVELRGVKKSFAEFEVIHGVNLEVAHGKFVALVGPSGCGKSTFLRMVAGLEDVSAGEIRIAGSSGLPCRVTNTELIGREILIYGTVAGQPGCVSPVRRPPAKVGEVAYFRPEAGRLSIFDEHTGLRHVA